LMTLKSKWGFYVAVMPCLCVIVPMTFLTLNREDVFANELSFWTSTLQTSPFSAAARNAYGLILFEKGQPDEAQAQFKKALEICPDYVEAHNNLGLALFESGRVDEALIQ